MLIASISSAPLKLPPSTSDSCRGAGAADEQGQRLAPPPMSLGALPASRAAAPPPSAAAESGQPPTTPSRESRSASAPADFAEAATDHSPSAVASPGAAAKRPTPLALESHGAGDTLLTSTSTRGLLEVSGSTDALDSSTPPPHGPPPSAPPPSAPSPSATPSATAVMSFMRRGGGEAAARDETVLRNEGQSVSTHAP